MPSTPRGVIDYPAEGDTDWYTQAENGLEAWLLRAELLGIPTYETFSDLPSAGTTEVVNPGTGQDQRQFAAVKGDATIYRDNGTSWVAWANYYTDADAEAAINNDADHGSTAAHNYFSGDHADLTNVGASQHHTRYADSEARGAVEAGNLDKIPFVNHEQGDYDTDGVLYWDLSAGLYMKSSNAPSPQTGGSLLWSSENFSAGSHLSASYSGEDKPTLDVLDSVNPVYQNGDEVILESMISPGFDTSTSSTSFVDLTTMPERGVLDWSKYQVLKPYVQQFDVWYGQYRVDAPLTLRVSYFGNGESGASKTDATYTSNAYRVSTRWTISDINNYGVWTPNFRAKSEDGSTVRVRGGGTLYLIAVT